MTHFFADGGQVVQALWEYAGRNVAGSAIQKAIWQSYVTNTVMPFAPVMLPLGFGSQEIIKEANKKGMHKDSSHN